MHDADRLVGDLRRAYDNIAASVSPDAANFENTLLPGAHAENAGIRGSRLLEFYSKVSTDPEIRGASRRAQALFGAFALKTSMREDLFSLTDSVLRSTGGADLDDPESRRLLQHFHRDHVAAGGLALPPGAARERFKEVRARIARLTAEFCRKVAEADEPGVFLTPLELGGVRECVVAGLERGEGEYEGMIWVPIRSAGPEAVMRSARSAEVRMVVQLAVENASWQDVYLFKEVVVFREEAARLLGYSNHAVFRMKERMAGTPEAVNRFLADLQSKLQVAGAVEVGRLREAKKSDLEARVDGYFFPWDEEYYAGLLCDQATPAEGQKVLVSDYFPLQNTLAAVLAISQHLFGLRFCEIVGADRNELAPSRNGNDIVWQTDVRLFTVWDIYAPEEPFLGYLYLDLYARGQVCPPVVL